MSGFQEYPKRLSHPQHQAAVWKTLPGKGVGLFAPDTIMTSPERFPEVTVTTLEQEQQYASKGYRPNNVANPAEYEQAILEGKPVNGYVNTAYPKWKYHAYEIPKIVKNEVEEQELGNDWHDTPVEATEEEEVQTASDAKPSVAPEPKAVKKPAAKKAVKKPKVAAPEKIDRRTKAFKEAQQIT